MNNNVDLKDSFKQATLRATSKEKFNMDKLFRSLVTQDPYYRETYDEIIASLGVKPGEHVIKGMIREAFFIQMVHTRGGAAQFTVRWEVNDARQADYEACVEIFKKLRIELRDYVRSTENKELLAILPTHSKLPYEIPVDYIERRTTENIHVPDNVHWFGGDAPAKAIKLRRVLLGDRKSTNAKFFRGVYNKIKTKVYLTDRAQTGIYQTNREQRWEVHPLSVQFSLRENCMEIEYKLLNQIFYFDGSPEATRKTLEETHLIEPLEQPLLCPITLDPLSFSELETEILNPQHGKAKFQVGHMNPLKAEDEPEEDDGEEDLAVSDESGETDKPEIETEQAAIENIEQGELTVEDMGHVASNISWVTADGNRIQGHLALNDVQALLTRIANNYRAKGYV